MPDPNIRAATETTLDDKMFPALEGPASALVVVFGLFSALRVLKLPAAADHYLGAGSQVAFSLVVFWALWRAFAALLDHLDEVARERSLGVAAFMPWIRKTLLTGFVVVASLLVFLTGSWLTRQTAAATLAPDVRAVMEA